MIHWREWRGIRQGDAKQSDLAEKAVAMLRLRAKVQGKPASNLDGYTDVNGDTLVLARWSKTAPDEVDVWIAEVVRYGEDQPDPKRPKWEPPEQPTHLDGPIKHETPPELPRIDL
jgi:hypothetical protein